jgi:hypothetical protein
VLRALRGLQGLLDDQTLTVKKVRAGSIIVELDGFQYAYEWLQHLFSTGQPLTIGGFAVKSVRELPSEQPANPATTPKGLLGESARRSDMKNDFDILVEHLLSGNIFLEEAIELLEKRMIQGAVERSAGNRSLASKLLGIHRNTLLRKFTEYGLSPKMRRKPAAKASRPRRASTKLA